MQRRLCPERTFSVTQIKRNPIVSAAQKGALTHLKTVCQAPLNTEETHCGGPDTLT